MKKIRNNNGSTLVIALIVVLIITMIATITIALIGANSNASFRKLQNSENKLILENKMYDYLANIITTPDNSSFLDGGYFNENIEEVSDATTAIYQMVVSQTSDNYYFEFQMLNSNLTLKATVSFTIETNQFTGYQIITWGY